MNMVEKMARAIDPDAWEPLEGEHSEGIRRFLDHIVEKRQERARIDALAALRALREPSEGMVDAAYSGELDWGPGGTGEDATADKVWRLMIDAAIHEAETA